MQILLQAGADINRKNHGGYTALMLAEYNGCNDAVQYLQATDTQKANTAFVSPINLGQVNQ
jgi:ankyrin repeat protein